MAGNRSSRSLGKSAGKMIIIQPETIRIADLKRTDTNKAMEAKSCSRIYIMGLPKFTRPKGYHQELSSNFYVAKCGQEEEDDLVLASVDVGPWHNLAKRRVQHYGYEFCYNHVVSYDGNKIEPKSNILLASIANMLFVVTVDVIYT
ncbi:hypothetical protein Tco_0716468, partial [Tanacetum coccineum]